jgi:hypothetical protein
LAKWIHHVYRQQCFGAVFRGAGTCQGILWQRGARLSTARGAVVHSGTRSAPGRSCRMGMTAPTIPLLHLPFPSFVARPPSIDLRHRTSFRVFSPRDWLLPMWVRSTLLRYALCRVIRLARTILHNLCSSFAPFPAVSAGLVDKGGRWGHSGSPANVRSLSWRAIQGVPHYSALSSISFAHGSRRCVFR